VRNVQITYIYAMFALVIMRSISTKRKSVYMLLKTREIPEPRTDILLGTSLGTSGVIGQF
jgi:hypothetical protein